MKKTIILILVFLLAACSSATPVPPTTVVSTEPPPTNTPIPHTATETNTNTPEPTATFTPTNTLSPTATLTNTPEPTATATNTPTPEPDLEELLVGKWECATCPRPHFVKFIETGNGLQHEKHKDGDVIVWIGPSDCRNIYVAFSGCAVTIHDNENFTIFYTLWGSGFHTDYTETLVFNHQEGTYTRTSAVMTNYPDDGEPHTQSIIDSWGVGPYIRAEE